MTTKLIDNMNLNCAVKLLRYDDLPTSNNEAVVSVLSNNADTGNQSSADVKRSVRISRKRTKPNIEDSNQSENVKKKKCMTKKPQLMIKIESGKTTDTPHKEQNKNKIQDSSSVKSNESYLINDDLSVISNATPCSNNFIDDEETTSIQSSSKPLKFKISKSIIAVKKKPVIHDVNKDNPINEVAKTENSVGTFKSPKTKTLKSITSNKKKPILSNVSKNNTSYELEESNNDNSTKAPKIKTPKSNTSNKKKSMTNNVNNVDQLDELQVNDNCVKPQASNSKTSKLIVSNRKKPAVNSININGATDEHETSNKIEIPRKRSRTSIKKEKCQKSDFDNICNNEVNLEQSQNSGNICETLYTDEALKLSQNFDDDTMMLRGNKPPKIKKIWSDEWSGDKLFKILPKSSNEEFSNDSTLDVNNCKTVKRIPKTQKSKNSNCKKVKTKVFEQLDPTNSPLIYTSSTDCDNIDRSSINVPVVQNDGISITFNIPLNDSIPAVCNEAVSEPIVYNTLSSGTLSNISIIPTTGIESSFSNKNVQQSHLSTLEPISDSDYLSVSTISPENTEMSYGMAILSEAISRQCRESANQNLKKKTPEPETIEVQSCPKKANSTPRPQVPSAMVSPQRVIKNMSKKVLKYSPGLCLQSVENELESHSELEIQLLSKRFDIPINTLRRTVVDEPLSVFQKKYSKSVTPSMVTISPIVKDADSKSGLNLNYVSGNIDVEYKLEPIREGVAYEKNNLKDLMLELSKTMPSWSLSIVTNPSRYIISQMSIGKYGVPNANKCIVLDRMFRASVYINQSLEHKLSKRYTTATEIVNLIKELNSM
ncbi:uncharacterized protein DDB_G0287625-like [Rhopalosiphum padi]|uniref:uncharacterized protein DDB_G0287625-like n=1 Tax=Rhopalosiphum padi TaxID=40932 RepID=UPI00298E8438|nr:uncharacterized protein DDB_G0287625-like [Rhopalosiphum padi]XP_060849262.1 uncharacterized protein DDB_G0287625-like [Rhopalosiphum padi]XP_060849263.1 uncharacterized protein DDB_G0287625-like [Rhopalosiphum padi]XP_060849264.1 uncharacterized protein DDB_G0287625-like [Rhopalosiphum padi]